MAKKTSTSGESPEKRPDKGARGRGGGKAARPEVLPLGDHLAALLNPALVGQSGFSEAPAPYDAQDSRQLEPAEAAQYGLGQEPAMEREKPRRRPPPRENVMTGAGPTADSLQALLEAGDPNLRDAKPWTPHRPARPIKSEGGHSFEIVSEFEPQGDQPKAIDELVKGVKEHERDQVLLGV